MTLDVFITLIKDIGFPIACVVALYVLNLNMQKQQREDNTLFRETIEKNTLAITKLSSFITSLFQHNGKGDDI